MIMNGNLQFINSQLLFQYLENNRKSVTFRVQLGEWDRNFYFDEGKIVWVSSESPGELLGDWLVREQLISGDDMRQLLDDSRTAREQFTSYLMDVGRLSREDLEDAILRLARFIIFRTFQENSGEFQIYPGIPAQVREGKIRLSPQYLILEFGQAADSPPPEPVQPEAETPPVKTSLADSLRPSLLQIQADEKIEFPVLPETAIQLYRKLRNPTVTGAEIGRMVMTSPELSARILRLANSPLLGIGRQVDSLPQAVALLGFEKISRLAMVLSFRSLRRSTRFIHLRRRYQSWSVATAFAAHDFAFVTGKDVEEFFLLGLLYRMGSIMALDLLEKRLPSLEVEKLEIDPGLDAALQTLEPEFLTVWGSRTGLPDPLLQHLTQCCGRSSSLPEARLLEKASHMARGLAAEEPSPSIDSMLDSLQLAEIGVGPDELMFLRQLLTASLNFSRGVLQTA